MKYYIKIFSWKINDTPYGHYKDKKKLHHCNFYYVIAETDHIYLVISILK